MYLLQHYGVRDPRQALEPNKRHEKLSAIEKTEVFGVSTVSEKPGQSVERVNDMNSCKRVYRKRQKV